MKSLLTCTLIAALACCALAQTTRRAPAGTLPPGYWPLERSRPISEKMQTVRLAPDLSQLSEGERKAVEKLLAVGQIFQSVYEQQRHARALAAQQELVQLDRRLGAPEATQNLLTLYRLNQGPIATTLENRREPFLPVEMTPAGQNVYPWGITKQEVDAFVAAHP